MATIASIAVGLVAKTGEFDLRFKSAAKSVGQVGSAVRKTVPTVNQLKTAMDLTQTAASRLRKVLVLQVAAERKVAAALKATQRARQARHAALRKVVARKRRILANEAAAEKAAVAQFAATERKRRAIMMKTAAAEKAAVAQFAATERKRRAIMMKTAAAEKAGRARRSANLRVAGQAALAAGVAFIFVAKRVIQNTDALAKMSERIGVAVDDMSRLEFAASQTGANTAVLTIGLQRMTRRISEAAVGMGEAQGALKELGLDVKSLAKLAPDKQFIKISEAMKQVKSSGDRVRLTFKLFDSEGVALKNTLALGEAGMKKMADEADRLGITIEKGAAQKMGVLNNAIDKMGKAFTGFIRDNLIVLVDMFGGAETAVARLDLAFQRLILPFRLVAAAVNEAFLLVRELIVAMQRLANLPKLLLGFEDAKETERALKRQSEFLTARRKVLAEGAFEPLAAAERAVGDAKRRDRQNAADALKEETQQRIARSLESIDLKTGGATFATGFAVLAP